jgi:hypothetical protein
MTTTTRPITGLTPTTRPAATSGLTPTTIPPAGATTSKPAPFDPTRHSELLRPETFVSADNYSSLSFATSRCPFGTPPDSEHVHDAGHVVALDFEPTDNPAMHASYWTATWREARTSYVWVEGENDSEADVVRFIAGLKVSSPSTLGHR